MKIVKKLSVGKLISKAGIIAALPDSKSDKTAVSIGHVVGVARGTKTGESTFGPWECLMGDFVFVPAVGDNAGIKHRSGQLFLPDVALDLVAPIASNLERGAQVELAFEITAENDADSATGYVYGCRFLVEPDANSDPLAQLMARALPAPIETVDEKTGEITDQTKGGAKK